eukprot:TRINITY_DN86917_c0_g1_i1.p1 TRINITY_DN86917_c0_g1~~TRINITY_DN86917_c0_g1_i1.p1  ORF type:complete len:269 (-),score=74.74 TRINITY_DN86917_c0_g1_i1:8-772(-)
MAPSRGPLEEAMKAKLRQMQAARDADVRSVQEQLQSTLAEAQGRDERLQEAEARLQGLSNEVVELSQHRSTAWAQLEAAVEQCASSEQQNTRLREQLEQAYAARADLESRMVEEAKSCHLEVEESLLEKLDQAKAAAAAWALECRGLEEEATAEATMACRFQEQFQEKEAAQLVDTQRHGLELEDLKVQLQAAQARAERTSASCEEQGRYLELAESQCKDLKRSLAESEVYPVLHLYRETDGARVVRLSFRPTD